MSIKRPKPEVKDSKTNLMVGTYFRIGKKLGSGINKHEFLDYFQKVY